MGELKHAADCQSHIVDVRGRPDECTCGADTRPRTEGRGDEPVAWQEAAEPFFRLAREVINPVNGERPWHADSKDWMVVFSFAGQSVTLGDLRRAAVASPIREPEISRTGPMFILPGEDPVEYMALMRQKAAEMDREVFLGELAEAMFKVDEKHGPIRMNVPYGALKSFQRKQYERYAEAVADAILNLAPVGGRGEEGSSRADLSPASRSQTPCDLDQKSWEVEVRLEGVSILTIGHEHLAGLSDIDRYADAVRTCGNHLLSFIGPEEPQPCFYCGDEEQAEPCPVCAADGDLSGAQRSELSTQLLDELNPSINEESQTNGS